MTTTFEVLSRARELIADPQHWTQHAMARTESQPVSPTHPRAVCWCTTGAIMKAAPNLTELDRYQIAAKLNLGIPHDFPQEHCAMTRVMQYNDNRSHSEVLAMFDKTIEALKCP